MRRSLFAALFASALGCPRAVPDHLRIDETPEGSAATAPITDVKAALAAIVGRDPLARSPSLLDPNVLEELPGGDPLAAFVRQVRTAELGQGAMDRLLLQIEDEWPGTAAVPLSRGYRLRLAENHLASKRDAAEQSEAEIVALVTPLTRGISDPTLPLRPLQWIGARLEGSTDAAASDDSASVRRYAERWVLTGWLSSPDLPVAFLADLLQAPQYDSLRAGGEGELLLARARAERSAEGAGPGLTDLRKATLLALSRAAADRDKEQAAFSEQLEAARAEAADPDPIAVWLRRSVAALSAEAGRDQSCGAALLALAALRWEGACALAPCGGLDRVETFGHAARWDPEVADLAAVWRVIALKETIDSLDVGRDSALYPQLAADLTDALLGTGAGPIEATLLRKQRPDPQTWLVIGRAVGVEGVADWEGARAALGEHLAAESRRAAAEITSSETLLPAVELLNRISSRALP